MSKEAMRLALEGAANYIDALGGDSRKYRQALAEQPAQQEPVAWTLTEELEKRETTTRAHLWFSDPVNCMWTPLYTSPPAQRKPLTDDELDLMCEKALFCRISFQQFARSIEAAHGIKENT